MADQSEKKMYRLITGQHRGFYGNKMVNLIAGTKNDTGIFSPSFVKKFPGRFVEVEEDAPENVSEKTNVSTGSAAVSEVETTATIDLSMSESKLLPLIEKATNPTLLHALFDEEEAGANRAKVKKALQARYTAIKPAKTQSED